MCFDTLLRALGLAYIGCLIATPVPAHEVRAGELVIVHPYTIEPDSETATAADVYMTIRNTSDRADRLLSVSSPMAAVALSQLPGRAAQPASAGGHSNLEIAPKSDTRLGPQGAHVALSGLKAPLYGYAGFALLLTFEKAGTVELDVLVEER